jgi:hypothetical protein
MKAKLVASTLAGLGLGLLSATAGAITRPTSLMGDSAPLKYATRTVVLDSGTRHVDVLPNETVKFQTGAGDFAVNFNGSRSGEDLRDVAPAGALDHTVRVYVMLDPLHISGS